MSAPLVYGQITKSFTAMEFAKEIHETSIALDPATFQTAIIGGGLSGLTQPLLCNSTPRTSLSTSKPQHIVILDRA